MCYMLYKVYILYSIEEEKCVLRRAVALKPTLGVHHDH